MHPNNVNIRMQTGSSISCTSSSSHALRSDIDGSSREAAAAVFGKWPTGFLGSTKSVISR